MIKIKRPTLLTDNEKTIERLEQEIFQLREIIDNFPGDVYWKNREGVWLGVNKRGSDSLQEMGFLSEPKDIVGKTDEAIFGKETAKTYRDNDWLVMNENREIAVEEATTLPSGETVIKYSTKKPLYNHAQEIVGIIGSSMDITERKEAEALLVENEAQRARIQEQDKFNQIARQLSHDIRSPLAAAQIWYDSIRRKLTEQERIMGGHALGRAMDILNSGFVRYQSTSREAQHTEQIKPVMILLALEQVLAEKRLEYQELPVILTLSCHDTAVFSFVSVNLSALKRMVSNLINNAIDALAGKIDSHVTLYLKADQTMVTLSVEDNGNGMSDDVQNKILNQVAVTDGKAHGNGIGFTQIWETLNESHAELYIDSRSDIGTRIDVIFPRIAAPDWIIENLPISEHQTIVVVDDDPSIHHAWDSRLYAVLPHIQIVHFEQGEEAIEFLNTHVKNNVLLLTDYELLNQPLNGLDLIEKTHSKNAILVTSHAENEKIQERSLSLNTKILPKQLVAKISIELQTELETDSTFLPTEVVLMDDDKIILDSIVPYVFSKRIVDIFMRPQDCLAKLDNYTKETVFFMDHHYGANPITGIDVAKKLHEQGFNRLYLLTGDDTNTPRPDYLTVILKTDTERLKAIADACFQGTPNNVLPLIEVKPPFDTAKQENLTQQKMPADNPELINVLLKNLSHEVLNSLSIIQVNADLVKLIEESEEKTGEEIKQAVLERVENIRQSRKECTQILRMEIAKLRAAYPLSNTMLNKWHAINNTIELALSEYVFRERDREKILYDGTIFDYYGDADILKQMLFHVIRQGLQSIKEMPLGTLTFHCTRGTENFHQLIVQYTKGEDDKSLTEPFDILDDNAYTIETKLTGIFCQSVMTMFGGYIEHSRVFPHIRGKSAMSFFKAKFPFVVRKISYSTIQWL